ncbi:MAG: ABC-three component system middle component 5 [Oceanicaulis sp.]
MITYHSFYDLDHTTFRILAQIIRNESIDIERAQIYDFVTLFPHALNDVLLPHNSAKRIRQSLRLIPAPYQKLPDKRVLFRRGAPLQHQATRLLIASGIVSTKKDNARQLFRTESAIDSIIKDKIENYFERKYIEFSIVKELDVIQVHGPKGLKARTKLLEYSYDSSIK